jgi:Tol biopolymer transport system component
MQLRKPHWILALVTAAGLIAADSDAAKVMMEAARKKEVVDGDLNGAIREYSAIVAKYKNDRPAVAMALVHMAECYHKMGDAESRKIYEQVMKDYADQKEAVALARAGLGGNAKEKESGILARQLWSIGPNYQITNSTPSPDGSYIPFIRLPDRSLGLHNIVTGEDRMLANDGGRSQSPVFTPNGKQILYGWQGPGGNCELRMIDADGNNVRTVLAVQGGQCGPRSISPDGKMAAIHTMGLNAPQISLVNLVSGQRTILKSFSWGNPIIGNFSPDGRRLVYSIALSRDSHDREVYSIAVDGTSETKLVSAPGWHDRLFYTPDGSRVVFSSDRSGVPHKWDLWSQRIVGDKPEGAPALVKPDIGDVWLLGFARDGSLYFAEQRDYADAYVVEMDPTTWRAKGTPKRASDRIIGSTQTPVWSPDGKSLAYVNTRTAYPNVTFLVRASGSPEEREFTVRFTSPYNARYFRWFPDSKSLLLVDWNRGNSVFRRLDITTGEVRNLFQARTENQGVTTTAVSADGQAVYYGLKDPESDPKSLNTAHVIRHDLETGEEKKVVEIDPGDAFLFFSVSPDDRYIAFYSLTSGAGRISVAPLSGGAARELWREHKDKWINTKDPFPWTSDSSGILVNVVHGPRGDYEGDRWHLSLIPVEGGEPRDLGIEPGARAQQLATAVHPSGHFVAYTENTYRGALWTLKNLFSETRPVR